MCKFVSELGCEKNVTHYTCYVYSFSQTRHTYFSVITYNIICRKPMSGDEWYTTPKYTDAYPLKKELFLQTI